MLNTKWVLCPVCGSKTRNRIREDILVEYPCNLHRHNFQHCAARHDKEPNLSCVLGFGNRCRNGCNDNQKCTYATNNVRDADKRKYSRCATAVNGMLNGFV